MKKPWMTAVTTAIAALASAATSATAQAPTPTQLPWSQPGPAGRAQIESLGFRGVRGAAADSVQVFTAERRGTQAWLTVRYHAGKLWHAFYSVEGDSAAVQEDLNRAAAAVTARVGSPSRSGDGTQTWILANRRRFALPVSARRLDNGRFGYAATYHQN